jgi:Raf kinase inhibitor-like YbhB/YbcL family protein
MILVRLSFAFCTALVACGCKDNAAGGAEAVKLSIPAFAAEQSIPEQFTCEGADRSPELKWSEPPTGTHSFALIVDDPDAPGGVFAHWGVFNIDAAARQLEQGAGNAASTSFQQARNDFGVQGYKGPCPPRGHGAHRYRFKLFALDISRLDNGPSPRISDLERTMDGHVLGSTTVIASFGRD